MILTHLVMFSFLDGASAAAAATTVAGHPKPFGQKLRRVILRSGQVLIARNDEEYQVAVSIALEELDGDTEAAAARPRRMPKVVEVAALPEPEVLAPLPVAFFDNFLEQLTGSVQQSQLLRLWDEYLLMVQEEEDIEMILLAA